MNIQQINEQLKKFISESIIDLSLPIDEDNLTQAVEDYLAELYDNEVINAVIRPIDVLEHLKETNPDLFFKDGEGEPEFINEKEGLELIIDIMKQYGDYQWK